MTFFGVALLTAVPTVILAVFAIVTAWYARKAFREQSKEVRDQAEILRIQSEQLAEDRKVNAEQIRVLKLQAEELRQVSADRDRDATETRRTQAVQVYMSHTLAHAEVDGEVLPGMTVEAYVRSTSPQPIYDLRVEWEVFAFDVGATTAETWLDEAPLLPGAMASARVPVPHDLLANADDVTAVATFRDRAGVWWRTRPDGRLEEIPEPPPPAEPPLP